MEELHTQNISASFEMTDTKYKIIEDNEEIIKEFQGYRKGLIRYGSGNWVFMDTAPITVPPLQVITRTCWIIEERITNQALSITYESLKKFTRFFVSFENFSRYKALVTILALQTFLFTSGNQNIIKTTK